MSFTLERGGRAIHGTVETSAGEPVEGVRVAPLGTVQTVATTDASGEFTVWVHEGIDPEKFAILAWALGYADQVKQLHDDEPLLFVLERESVIVGRVIDERKMPVVRARVGSGTADGRPGSVVRTDEQGAFKLPALARGQYHLWARTDDAEGRLSEAINLEAGRTSAEQVIVLHPLTPPKSKPPAIETGLATDKPRPKLVVVPPRPKKRSDRLVRKILARMLRKCGEGREGTIEVASKFIIDDGSLLSPTITVIGDAAMDPTIEACSLERATKLRFHPRSSPTAFRTAKVKL